MRIFLLISFICSLAYALTTTPGWNAGNVVLNSITGTSGNLPITSTAGNPINIIPGATPAWNFTAPGHLVPNSNAAVDIGSSSLRLRDQYLDPTSIIYRGADKFISSPGIDNFHAGRAAGSNSFGSSNSFTGAFSGVSITSGSGNTHNGANSGLFSTTSNDNSLYGLNSGRFITSASRSSVFGKDAGMNIYTNNNVTAIGYQAAMGNALGAGLQIGADTTAVGKDSAKFAISGCVGAALLGVGTGTVCNASGLTAVGNLAANINSTGANGSFYGDNSGLLNTIGADNSCFGKDSCSTTVNGNRLIMLGKNVNATSSSASDELGIGTWIRGNSTSLDLKAFGVTGLSLDTSGNVFTPSSKFNLNSNGNITSINNVATSWPASQGAASTFLQNDGSGNLSWVAGGGGVATMAAVGAVPNANGATISGATLNLQPADGTFPGALTAVTQIIGGDKNFTGSKTQVKALGVSDSGIVFTPNNQQDIRSDSQDVASYTLTAIHDVSHSLNSKYFYLSSMTGIAANPFVDYYFWFNVGGTGVDPAPRPGTGIQVAFPVNSTAGAVATAINTAINTLPNTIVQSTVLGSVITIVGQQVGAPQLPASSGNSGMAVAVLTTGLGQVYSQYSNSFGHGVDEGAFVGSLPGLNGANQSSVIFNRAGFVTLSTYPNYNQIYIDGPIVNTAPVAQFNVADFSIINGNADINVTTDVDVSYGLVNQAIGADGFLSIKAGTGIFELWSASGHGVSLNGGAGNVAVDNSELKINTLGKGLSIASGANSRLDSCTLVAGTCTIANTTVQAVGTGPGTDSIFCTGQDDNGGVAGAVRVSSRTAGVSYIVTSTSALDTSIVACQLVGAL